MRHGGHHLDQYRKTHPTMGLSPVGTMYGYFLVPLDGKKLNVISSGERHSGEPYSPEAWEHVSVSLNNRCPTWREMKFVKDLFWEQDELVLQFHPPKSDYVNVHEYCLHLWRSPFAVELPPVKCV